MLIGILHKLSTISKGSCYLTKYLKVAHFKGVTDSTVSGCLVDLFRIC